MLPVAGKGLRVTRRLLRPPNLLSIAERTLLQLHFRSEKSQIFVLGLPRSGTTLVYQYLAHRLNVAYFTNGVGVYPYAPCLVSSFQIRRHDPYRSDFSSYYGKGQGPNAPREAGSFWGRVFGIQGYRVYEELRADQVKLIQRTVHCVQKSFGNLPFVNKNVKHLLRIEALSKIFPNAYFLVVERNMGDVALSVLRGREILFNGAGDWVSAQPPNYTEFQDTDLPDQIAHILVALNARLEVDLATLAPDRVLHVNYERFCEDPEHLISLLTGLLGNPGFRQPPEKSFRRSTTEADSPEAMRLLDCLRQRGALD